MHLNANSMAGLIAVVACDKPPGRARSPRILEHNAPAVHAVRRIDPARAPTPRPASGSTSSRPSSSPADPDPGIRTRLALHACPGQGSCGGMFTYNTMQTFIARARDGAAAHGVAGVRRPPPPGRVPRPAGRLPDRDHHGRASARATSSRRRRCAMRSTVAIAMGGSTNVVLHSVEIARAAGFDLWDDVLSQSEFNALSRRLPGAGQHAPVRLRTRWSTSMPSGGVPVIVKELLDAGLARRRGAHLHRRDAGRAGPTARSAGARRRRDPPRREAVQGHRRAAPAARATWPPTAARC